MHNDKRLNQSDISPLSCASRPNETDSHAQRCARLAGISGGNGGELSAGIFSRRAMTLLGAFCTVPPDAALPASRLWSTDNWTPWWLSRREAYQSRCARVDFFAPAPSPS